MKIRNWLKRKLDLYDIEDLQTGAHCGCCGTWIENEIVPKNWPWNICPKCLGIGKTKDMVKHKR